MTIGGLVNAEPTVCSRNVVIVPNKNLKDVAKVNIINILIELRCWIFFYAELNV